MSHVSQAHSQRTKSLYRDHRPSIVNKIEIESLPQSLDPRSHRQQKLLWARQSSRDAKWESGFRRQRGVSGSAVVQCLHHCQILDPLAEVWICYQERRSIQLPGLRGRERCRRHRYFVEKLLVDEQEEMRARLRGQAR